MKAARDPFEFCVPIVSQLKTRPIFIRGESVLTSPSPLVASTIARGSKCRVSKRSWRALSAVRIRFEPAVLDGNAVSQTMLLQYSFNR